MNIEKDKSLLNYNTFHVEAFSSFFAEVTTVKDLEDLFQNNVFKNNNKLILGGGSNILFTRNFEGLVIHSAITDLIVLEDNEKEVVIRAGSGYNWDQFVEYCVQKNWGGIENLSDIPGNVGAAPVQNIGAYGVEAKDTIVEVHTFNLDNGKKMILSNAECKFDYRKSIFKQIGYKNYFVTHVVFRLSKNPALITHYGTVEEELKKTDERNIQVLRNVIIKIRQSKLPPVDEVASAGSFFKNPVIKKEQAEKIKEQYNHLPQYHAENDMVKVPAAWLIEQCGLKGYISGNVGTYINQPLVIVNLAHATGAEIADFSKYIQKLVYEKFSIKLEPEVCFI